MLASAPTGSGKTLTAFLEALSRFAAGALPASGMSVLYVSPLKALNEDVRRNLSEPLGELRSWFAGRGAVFPQVQVATRSGDSSASERRRMAAHPPSILCTTPESLSILLASRQGIQGLATVRLVILDEIHALLGSKRGSILACSVGRLASIAGEFQRVALSATVKPFDRAASFVGGRRLVRGADGRAEYEERRVAVIAPASAKRYEFEVAWPPPRMGLYPTAPGGRPGGADGMAGGDGSSEPAGRYGAIAADLASRLADGRSVVAFVDSRRRAERLASMINGLAGEGSAWAHHGSLSREVRSAVEARLKKGLLKCVVATGTLELGIDVGTIDLVALAGTPARADQVLQRAGRAGHGVGLPSKAVLYPFHGLDLLAAAAAVGAALDGDVDPIEAPDCPLDVLAQVILSMCLFDERDLGGLYDEIRSFPPYAALSRGDFDDVVGLLAGRYEGTRLKELAPRLRLDPERGTVKAKDGAAMLLYSSGGAIPDRGAYEMRLEADGSRIGELDEEFVFERRVGNSFMFGAQSWRIVGIDDQAVTVAPLPRGADFMPFWKADKAPRGESISRRMREACAAFVSDRLGFETGLPALGFGAAASSALVDFLSAQARVQAASPNGSDGPGDSRADSGAETPGSLPGPAEASMELYASPAGQAGVATAMVHTLRGAAVNEAMSLALAWELGAAEGVEADRLSNDDTVTVAMPLAGLDEAEASWRKAAAALAGPGRMAAALAAAIPASGAFGAAFRENAGRALLLPRPGFGKRVPLWITRLRARKLFDRASAYPDFPLLRETWKTVLGGRVDAEGAAALCAGIADGSIAMSVARPAAPGPFASSSGWAFVNRYMYAGDELGATRGADAGFAAGLSAGELAVRDAIADPSARPRIDPGLAAEYGRKARRELQGWAPESADDLAEWVAERAAIPLDEWEALLAVSPPELALEARRAIAAPGSGSGLLSRLVEYRFPGAELAMIARRERASGLAAELAADPGLVLSEWLASTGPVSLSRLAELFGPGIGPATSPRSARPSIIVDDMGELGGERGVRGACDVDALERLVRTARSSARASVEPRPRSELFGFVAVAQGLKDSDAARDSAAAAGARALRGGSGQRGEAGGITATGEALRRLAGFPAPAGLWETEILPARVEGYKGEYLDGLLSSGSFLWFGADRGMVAFCPVDEYEAFAPVGESALLAPGQAPADLWELMERGGLTLAEAEKALWDEAWAGLVSSTDFEPVRKAAAAGFRRVAIGGEGRSSDATPLQRGRPRASGGMPRVPLSLRGRWRSGAPVPGLWFPLSLGRRELADAAATLSLEMARARIVARRYGVVAAPLLDKETPGSSWPRLFRALRRLEMSGEFVSGRFFDGLPGPQFADRDGLRRFMDGGFESGTRSFNAADPAATPGLSPRLATTRLCVRDGAAIAVSRRSYRELELSLEPEDPALPAALAFMLEARRREISPERRIVVETVNGVPAAGSRWAGALAAIGFEADRGSMTLW